MRIVRIAAISYLVDDAQTTVDRNRERGILYISEAAERGCDLVVLPEMFTTINTGHEIRPEPHEGPTLDRLMSSAHDHNINVSATYYVVDDGRVYNQTVILNRNGSIAGIYRKVQPTAAEALIVSAGNTFPAIDLDFGRVGVMICLEIYFPEIARIYAHKGVEILLWPTVTLGPTQEGLLAQAQSRAIDNCLYLVEANMAGAPPYAPYAGRIRPGTGRIIGPGGDVLASTAHLPGLAITDVDLDRQHLTTSAVLIRNPDHFRDDMQSITRLDLYAREYAVLARVQNRQNAYWSSIDDV